MAPLLEGKSAIVTGAGSGISLEFARLLLENGANVLLADLTLRPESQEVLDKYQNEPKAIFQKTDVSSWKQLTEMFERATSEFGPIDIVCPGAGVFEPPFSAFWYPPGSKDSKDDPFGDHYKTLDINLTHPIRVTQLAISHFLSSSPASGGSNIKNVVHIASTASEYAFLPFPLYHASKWGLAGFIRSQAALEKELGIRVTGVAPGAVKTPLWTENQDKLRLVTKGGEVEDAWITPRQVAEHMFGLVTGEEMVSINDTKIKPEGGMLLEIGAKNIREIPVFNNPGPDRTAAIIDVTQSYDNAVSELKTPGWGQV